jgi:DNA-binding response OmpR family regulator
MPGKVLIVDDEPNIVISLQFLMRKAGFETSVARDGDEACSRWSVSAPTWFCWT